MTDFITLSNTPLDVEIGGRKFKVRQLSMEGIFGFLQADIVSKRIADAHKMAAPLEGKDKIAFLRECMQDLPSGEELQNLVVEHLGTMEGVRVVLLEAMKADQPDMKLEDLNGLVTPDNVEELEVLVNYLCAFTDKVEPVKKTQKKTKAKKAARKRQKQARRKSR